MQKPGPTAPPRRGFTIVELLVVLSIIALLIAIILPVLGGALSTTRDATCRSNLKQWGIALEAYKLENDGLLPKPQHGRGRSAKDDPDRRNWYNALPEMIDAPRYTDVYDGSKTDAYSNENIWWCPTARDEFGPPGFTGSGNSFDYAFNTVIDGTGSYGPNRPGQQQIPADLVSNPAHTLAMSEPRARVNYLTITTSNFGGIDEDRHGETNANMLFLDSHIEAFDGAAAQSVYSGPGRAIDTTHWTTNEGDVIWGSFTR